MNIEDLTEKEHTVLTYFIENENDLLHSKSFGMPLKNNITIKECKDGDVHFLAYAAKIEKNTKKKVSKVWVSKICKEFEAEGILDHESIRPPRQKNETEYYYIKSDYTALSKIVRALTESKISKNDFWIFSRLFFQWKIDEKFVQKVLAEKHVSVRKMISLWDWEPKEAQDLFDEYFAEVCNSERTSLHDLVKKVVIKQFEGNEMYISPLPTLPHISLNLPVFVDDMDENDKNIMNLNKQVFEKYPLLRSKLSGIRNHYEHWQRETYIIPILALIKSSPKALAEFLFGDWEFSDVKYYSSDGTRPMQYRLFRILFTAISDISLTRYASGDVENVQLRPKYGHMVDKEGSLLVMSLKNSQRIYFDAGFDTSEDYIGADLIKNPDESYYWFKSDIVYWSFLKEDIFRNYNEFIDELVNLNDNKSKFIFDRLSNKIKNILISFNHSDSVPDELKMNLLNELNRMMFQKDIYEEGISVLKKSSMLSEYTKTQNEKNKDRPYFDIYDVINLNISVLEDTFPDQIIKNESRLWAEKSLK